MSKCQDSKRRTTSFVACTIRCCRMGNIHKSEYHSKNSFYNHFIGTSLFQSTVWYFYVDIILVFEWLSMHMIRRVLREGSLLSLWQTDFVLNRHFLSHSEIVTPDEGFDSISSFERCDLQYLITHPKIELIQKDHFVDRKSLLEYSISDGNSTASYISMHSNYTGKYTVYNETWNWCKLNIK